MPTPPADRRREILDEWARVRSGWDEMETQTLSEESQQHWQALIQKAADLRTEYIDLIPRVRLSRCPFIHSAVEYPIDTFGLDGAWWDHDQPRRPAVDPPKTLWALWGAVHVKGAPAATEFLCKPGPAVPYVLPALVGEPNVRAVLSQFAIGTSTAYAVACFAEGDTSALKRLAVWGTETLNVQNRSDRSVEAHYPPEMDFDLANWITSGDLLWIAPGDDELTLRRGVEGCPYLDLPGAHEVQHIQRGRLWTASDVGAG